MSKVTVVRNPKSGELYVLTRVKENCAKADEKAPDRSGKRPPMMMARLQLHPDPNMNTDSRLGTAEPDSPQSLGVDSQMSFNVYEARLSGSVTSLGELPNSPSTIGFLPEQRIKDRMVSWYSRRIRQLSVLLVIFVVLSLVMTGLFVWRVAYFSTTTNSRECANCSKKYESLKSLCPRQPCPVRARAVALPIFPKNITDKLSEIEKFLDHYSKENKISIAANVVYMDKVIWSGAFGRMNWSDPASPEMSDRAVFPIASGTKIITALMLYKLYWEGKIKTLDEPLVKYVPGFSVIDPFNSHNIVLREIVSHMSGLPREAPCFPQIETNFCPINNSVMMNRIKRLKLVVRPGTEAYYSNLGFGLLGLGLANSQNTSYEDWVQDNIFNPLGMKDSGFKLTPELRKKVPEGYIGQAPQQPKEWGWLNAAGGLFTSIADIAKLEIKLFNSTEREDFLSPLVAEELFSPAFILQDDQFVGSPWEMFFKHGYLARTKSGYVYGYKSTFTLFPELKLAMNLFATNELNGYNLAFQLLTVFHEVLTKHDREQQERISEESVAPFLGEFHSNVVPTLQMVEIRYSRGELYFVVDKKLKFHLYHLHGTTFEIRDRRPNNCLEIFVLGVNHEKLHFDPPLNTTKISPGFTIFGIHLSGKAYFHRKPS